jgi:hypothetical protein
MRAVKKRRPATLQKRPILPIGVNSDDIKGSRDRLIDFNQSPTLKRSS